MDDAMTWRPSWEQFSMKLLMTPQSRVLTPSILLGAIISATIVLTASADLTNCAPAPSGLVSWWRGEGSAVDSADSNDGTLLNGASFAAGMVGQAFSFNGSNQCVQIPYAPSLVNSNYSVEAWVKPLAQVSDAINQDVLFGQSYGQCQLLARTGSTGVRVAFAFGTDHFTFYEAAGTSEIPIGQFTHLAGTWDGTTLRLYINGVLNAQGTPGASPVDSGCAFQIGGFYSPAAGDCSYVGQFFNGLIDEVSYYKRALSGAEIQSIYNAGGAGKCPPGVGPSILTQPASQAVSGGATVTFTVAAAGTPPLSYQWCFSGTNIAGATGTSLTLSDVQPAQAGLYAVVVSNVAGSVSSSNAVLTVISSPPCAPPPSGLVSWWRGEGNCLDAVGTNEGTLQNWATFAPGLVGQGFAFDGVNEYVKIPRAPGLDVGGQVTIDFWMKADPSNSMTTIQGLVTSDFYGVSIAGGEPLGIGVDAFLSTDSGATWATTAEVNGGGAVVSPGQWHHIAATYDGTKLQLYVDAQPSGNPILHSGSISPMLAESFVAFGSEDGRTTCGGCIGTRYFNGLVDEVDIFNRALSASEIAAIYNANVAGKCVTTIAPIIYLQPSNQTVTAGANASFSAAASGRLPLSYQWQFNGSNLAGATATVLALTDVQPAQAGLYAVVVSNVAGSVSSSNAVLTVISPPPCEPPPSGLVSWWRGEGDCLDAVGTNDGTLQNGATFAAGLVGQGFAFDGVNDYVKIPKAASLDAPNQLTIDFWMNVDATQPIGSRVVGLFTSDFYGFEIGTAASKLGVQFFVSTDNGGHYVSTSDPNSSGAVFPAGEWHHIAGVYDGAKVQLYLDGQALGNPAPVTGQISPMLANSFVAIGSSDGRTVCSSVCIGTRYFKGLIDEVDFFNRALSASEVTAIYNAGAFGKCVPRIPPSISVQPTNQTVATGTSVTFGAMAVGTSPLGYQWRFNGTNVTGATGTALTLTDVQLSQSGSYSLVVSNAYGTVTSSNAVLTVNPPPPCTASAFRSGQLVAWGRGLSGRGRDE